MPTPAEAAAQKLARELGAWKSVELRSRSENENVDPARKPDQPRTFQESCRYIETAAGQRLYESRLSTDLDGEVTIQVDYTDGTKCATSLHSEKDGVRSQEQLRIQRTFGLEDIGLNRRPEPLRYLYVGLKPLPEALPQARYLGEDTQIGRKCDRFLFTHIKGPEDPVSRVYWLDRDTGITLRMEYYSDEQARSEGRLDHVWMAGSLDTVNSHHLALKSELLQYNPAADGAQRLLLRYRITTDEAVFDRDYPASTFWPTITKDMKVLDYVKNKVVSPRREAVSKPATATPIRAEEGPGWDAYASGLGWLVGLAALVAGAALWWRRGA